MIIRLKVFEQTLSIADTKSIPRKGSKDYLVLQFTFSSDWKDLDKLCYLQHGEVSQPIDVVDGLVEVPEWFTQQDRFDVTLFGKSGSQEVPTNVVSLRLEKSNSLWEQDAPEPQPSWLAKVIDLNAHPPIPGENGYWLIWDTDKGAYVESELSLPAVGGTSDHSKLINRDTADQHPMIAITGLVEALEGKQPAGMGITGAAVGQIAKITAVDDSGKPTAWEAEDLPNNEKFIVTFSGNDSSYVCDKTMVEIINAYENGQDISARFTGISPDTHINYTNLLLSLTTYAPYEFIEFQSDIEINKLRIISAYIDGSGYCGVSEYTALDNSLTENYMAADAKAVGDALARKQDTLIQSGATVGQIAKITAVDDSGKPTAWEAVDMPSGGGDVGVGKKRLIADITLTEPVKSILIDTDMDGNQLSLTDVDMFAYVATNAETSYDYASVVVNGFDAFSSSNLGISTTKKTVSCFFRLREDGTASAVRSQQNQWNNYNGVDVLSSLAGGSGANTGKNYGDTIRSVGIKHVGGATEALLATGTRFIVWGR